jgi:hypothetical protein
MYNFLLIIGINIGDVIIVISMVPTFRCNVFIPLEDNQVFPLTIHNRKRML